MSVAGVAERYSRAIFELGVETDQLKSLTDEMIRFAELYDQSEQLHAVLDNPLVDPGQREGILSDLAARLSLRPLTLNALRLLALRRRMSALPLIARRLRTLSDDRDGLLRAKVTSAVTLPEEYYRELTQHLEAALGRKIVLEREQDPTLIGGVVTRIGDNIIDGSIKGRLHELERRLLLPA